jgi:hypothetical protein
LHMSHKANGLAIRPSAIMSLTLLRRSGACRNPVLAPFC